jgi:hypothetical protein
MTLRRLRVLSLTPDGDPVTLTFAKQELLRLCPADRVAP